MANILQYCDALKLLGIAWVFQMKHQRCRTSLMIAFRYPSKETAAKKPIDDDTPNRSNGRTNPPNVIARLMGMDTLPSRRNAMIDRKVSKAQMLGPNIASSNKIDRNSPTSALSKQMKCTLLSYNAKRDLTRPHNNRRPTSMPRKDHPQEEQLRKFKKDFEAWQASEVLENPKPLVVDYNFHKGKYIQILAQENLNKVKMGRYIDPKRNLAPKEHSEANENFSGAQRKNDKRCQNDLQDGDHKQFEEDEEDKVDSSPTRIVILKPSFERKVDVESRLGSSEILEEVCSMRDFLEEVKERLKLEIQGNPTIRTTKRGTRPETLHTPRQIAHDIANQVGESVVRDIGKKLTRSESMRSSYKSDFLINGPDSPVFDRGGAKNILSEKLKNVFANEVSEASRMIKSRDRLKSMPDLSNIRWKEKRTASESASKHKKDDILLFDSEAVSPRNLVRSFSAPSSRRAFEKPFLEDSQIEKRREVSETTPKETKKNRKDSFSIRSRENNTEVPPSPASVSRSVRDEIRTSENPSPVSPLEVHVTENQPSPPRFSKDLNCNLPELSQLDRVENNKQEVIAAEQEASDNGVVEIESQEQAYIKNILVAAGLYENRSVDQANASRKIPISNQVFDEVEKSYSRYSKADNEDSFLNHGNIAVGHKLLFDLVNEAFSSASNIPKDSSTFRRWVIGRATVPHGKRLFDNISDQIQIYGDPQTNEMRAINRMLARDVRVATSAATLYENIDVSGKKIECAILGS
uniref:DUF3741 domain-containing protein n=1 Tax=Ananas comosus var. bracteatus TaxID=296719 RepID=A0A6V7NSC4_ANACO|nr:unnamed protein product [Ananas comosus var. bracteatus]